MDDEEQEVEADPFMDEEEEEGDEEGSDDDSDEEEVHEEEEDRRVDTIVKDAHLSKIKEPIYRDPTQRKTPRYLNKYERARILSVRALQLSQNAPTLLTPEQNPTNITCPVQLAMLELKFGIPIPLSLNRPMPDNTVEKFDLCELKHLHH